MPFRKKLTLLAFVVACCFWKSALAHAGNSNSSSRPQNSHVNEFGGNASVSIPGLVGLGVGLSRQTTDPTWHTQSAIKLWQQARKEFLKTPKNSRYAEYLWTVESQLRVVLLGRLKQNPPPFPDHQSGQTPPKIAYAQFMVTQTLETLNDLIGQEQQGSDLGKALRGMFDLIKVAESELKEIAKDPNANAQLKAQWESFVKTCDQPQKVAQDLRNQALNENATKEDWYAYARHLQDYELCSKTDEKIVNHFLKAAQSGHEDAAVRLLGIYQPQVICRALGDVFFKLFQLQINGQSPFIEEVRTEFLARAILVLNQSALKHLNGKIQNDIKQGVRRKPIDTKWQAWVDLGTRLKELVTTDETQRQMQVLIDDVNSMYQAKNAKKQLAQLSQFQCSDFPQSDSDEESDRLEMMEIDASERSQQTGQQQAQRQRASCIPRLGKRRDRRG